MKAVLGSVYKTQFGKYLRLDSIGKLLYFSHWLTKIMLRFQGKEIALATL